MRQFLAIVLLVSVLMGVFTETAFASSVLDMSVSNGGGGPTFIFTVSGDFSKINGTVQVEGGDSFPLYCRQTDETTVICHATKKITGQNVVVNFGGAKFWVNVPLPSIESNNNSGNSQYCYNVYGWNKDIFSGPTDWVLAGTHCQNAPANYGDSIEFVYINNVAVVGPPVNTYYYDSRGTKSCGFSDYGDAYYYYSFILVC